MADSVTCDNCGTTMPTAGLFGWFVVERFGIDMLARNERPGPWHLCGRDCLRAWPGP